jgi:hypothetical protein
LGTEFIVDVESAGEGIAVKMAFVADFSVAHIIGVLPHVTLRVTPVVTHARTEGRACALSVSTLAAHSIRGVTDILVHATLLPAEVTVVAIGVRVVGVVCEGLVEASVAASTTLQGGEAPAVNRLFTFPIIISFRRESKSMVEANTASTTFAIFRASRSIRTSPLRLREQTRIATKATISKL